MNNTYYIGLMSGTSADSLDAVLVHYHNNCIDIINTHSLPLAEETRNTIHQLAVAGDNEIAQLAYLDKAIAQLSATAVAQLCEKIGINHDQISAVGSHGQTIRHIPQDKNGSGYSLQVGDPNIIAEQTGITTVADFRRRDIAAGGHGAPLAPAFHQAAFHSQEQDRIILNTGGIANITYLPKDTGVTPIGFDTGPANGLMDSWCQRHLNTAFDNNGEWAKSGTVDTHLLQLLLKHPFFALPYPKSTGREDFNLPWLLEQCETYPDISPQNIQATLLALTVESISQNIEELDPSALSAVYVCGGGAKNSALMEALAQRLAPRTISSTEALGIPADWVEGVAFSWLAKQTMEKLAGNLPSVTGANKEVILGGVYWGRSPEK